MGEVFQSPGRDYKGGGERSNEWIKRTVIDKRRACHRYNPSSESTPGGLSLIYPEWEEINSARVIDICP